MLRHIARKFNERYSGPSNYREAHPLAPRAASGVPLDAAPTGSTLLGVRFLDPLGPVRMSRDGDTYIRLVSEGCAALENLQAPSVASLVDSGLMTRFRVSDAVIDSEFDSEVTYVSSGALRHGTPVSQWSRETYVQAATCWIDINRVLLLDGLCLLDAHQSNYAFTETSRPIWVDHGSIVKLDSVAIGISEFLACIFLPLWVLSRRPGLAGWSRGSRISAQEAVEIGGLVPSACFVLHLAIGGVDRVLSKSPRFNSPAVRRRLRSALMSGFAWYLKRLAASSPKGFWSDYRQPRSSEAVSLSKRDLAVQKQAVELNWASLMDLGANDGHHIIAIAEAVTERRLFIAVDTDDFAMSQFQRTKAAHLNHHTSARVGDFFSDQPTVDLVLALAITHHLSLQQHYPFGVIAKHLASRSKRHCLVEFMPFGLTNSTRDSRPTPSWYTLSNFLEALTANFKTAEIVYEHRSPSTERILILAQH